MTHKPDIAENLLHSKAHLLTEDILPALPIRHANSHKGTYGHAVIIGGSLGMSGAPVMASKAALRSGAGLVTAYVPVACKEAVSCVPELMSRYSASYEYFTPADAPAVVDFCKGKSAIAIGTGIGRAPETTEFIKEVIAGTTAPIVIDADALFSINDYESIANRAIMTPHMGEFARMTGIECGDIEKERFNRTKDMAVNSKLYLLLKGTETIISTPDGSQYISGWGTPSLAKGGSGDILTGIIAALLAQGYSLTDASLLGCYMQGMAARAAEKQRSQYSVIASDVIDCIGKYE